MTEASYLSGAIVKDNLDEIQAILDSKVDPNEDYTMPFIFQALCMNTNNSSEIVKMLLQHGAEPNVLCVGYGIMHCTDDISILESMLDHGANVNIKNDSGHTPLHTAQSTEVVNWLLEHGADPDIQDNEGHTPYEYQYIVNGYPVCRDILPHAEAIKEFQKNNKNCNILIKPAARI